MKKNYATMVKFADIRTDGGTQSRVELNPETVADYAQLIRDGVQLPPMRIYDDGLDLWLADGFHRLAGYRAAGIDEVEAAVLPGSKRDAILYSVGANAEHGLRRTNADKRRAVEILLADEEWSEKSDRWVADKCRVTHPFVAKVRSQVVTVTTCQPEQRDSWHENPETEPAREGKDGKRYKQPAAARPNAPKQEDHGGPDATQPEPKPKPQTIKQLESRIEALEQRLIKSTYNERELLVENEQLKEELARLDQITGSDEPMAAAMEAAKEADRKRVEMERVMQDRINGLLEEKAAVIRAFAAYKKAHGEK